MKEPNVLGAINDKMKPAADSEFVPRNPLTSAALSKQRSSKWGVSLPKHPGKKYGCGYCESERVSKAADMSDKYKNANKVAWLTLDGSECLQGPGWAVHRSLTNHQCQPMGRVEYFDVIMYLGCDCYDIDPNYGGIHDGMCFEDACDANTVKCGTTWYRNDEYLIDSRMAAIGQADLKPGDLKIMEDAKKNSPTRKLGPMDVELQSTCGCKNFNPGIRADNGVDWHNPRVQVCDKGLAAYYTGPEQCAEYGGQKAQTHTGP